MTDLTYFDDEGHAIHWNAPDGLLMDPFDEPPIEDIVLPIDREEYRRVQESILEDLYGELEL